MFIIIIGSISYGILHINTFVPAAQGLPVEMAGSPMSERIYSRQREKTRENNENRKIKKQETK
jgi:hypothetical protein